MEAEAAATQDAKLMARANTILVRLCEMVEETFRLIEGLYP